MSWIEENALKRVFNVYKRFKEQKGKLWDNDIEAIKTLSTALENNSKHYVNDNLLFAKLLCYCLDKNLHLNGDMKAAIKNVADVLKEPLNERIAMLTMNLNNQELNNYFKSLGLNIEHEKKSDLKKVTPEMVTKIKSNWTSETVTKSFYNTANDLLKDINNYN